MKATLKLELTPRQYQQLVECFFVGSVRLDEGPWPVSPGNNPVERQILSQAGKFGKQDMVFRIPGTEVETISKATEERLLPYLFDD